MFYLSFACPLFLTLSLALDTSANDDISQNIEPIHAPFDMPDLQRPTFPDRSFDIRDFGAVADGKTKNTEAIRKAIQACSDAGGGRVLIPAGKWLTGPIHLKSNINLHIEKDAEITFSTNFNDYLPPVFTRNEGMECYNYSSLIYAHKCKNIAITGKGTLYGQGKVWWPWKKRQKQGAQRLYEMAIKGIAVEKRVFGTEKDALRPSFLQPVECENVLIEGITLIDGPMWTVHPIYCENIIVRDIHVQTNGPNTDGINPDACKNMLIEHCFFDTGDDCIVLKSGLNEEGWRIARPCENIVIRYCQTKRGHGGVVIGSEMSAGVRNVFVHDCQFDQTDQGIRMKSMRGRGGIVENIWIQDISMGEIKVDAIRLNMFYKASTLEPRTKVPPLFRNIFIKNIQCQKAKNAVWVIGLPEKLLQNVTLENISIHAQNGADFTDARDIKIKNMHIGVEKGPAFQFKNCQDVIIEGSRCLTKADQFLKVEGKNTANFRLNGNDMSNSKVKISVSPEVPADAVILETDEFNKDILESLSNDRENILHSYLMSQANVQFEERLDEINEAVNSKGTMIAYQQTKKQNYVEILGAFPERTPLNAKVTGIIECDGYRIENVSYESQPHHHVTANLYLPTNKKGPFPGVLVPCGHSANGKAAEAYQKACILLAKNGFAALIVDPICQGERYQFLKSDGQPATRGGTTAHTLLDAGSKLVGTSVAAYEIWDNKRSIDYLLSRPEVRNGKVGCTGNSGGGGQTRFLMSLDDRIAAAAPSCNITIMKRRFETLGPGDGCQHLAGEGQFGIDYPDYITLFAPKPTLILAAEYDFVDINATSNAFREVKRVYKALGAMDQVDMFTNVGPHGFSKAQREAMVQWMKKWLVGENISVIENDAIVQKEEDLWVTETGQVGSYFKKEITVADMNLARAQELKSTRKQFWQDHTRKDCLQKVKQLIDLDNTTENIFWISAGTINRPGHIIEKYVITDSDSLPIPALLYRPLKNLKKLPVTLVVDGRGKETEAQDGLITRLLNQNRMVLSIDVRGCGETTDDPEKIVKKLWNKEHRNAMLSMHIGRPLLGQRVKDTLTALQFLLQRSDVDTTDIHLMGIQRGGPIALHAAYLNERFQELTLKQSISSWMDLLSRPMTHDQLAYVVPNALVYYDLPDLVLAISPRTVNIEESNQE